MCSKKRRSGIGSPAPVRLLLLLTGRGRGGSGRTGRSRGGGLVEALAFEGQGGDFGVQLLDDDVGDIHGGVGRIDDAAIDHQAAVTLGVGLQNQGLKLLGDALGEGLAAEGEAGITPAWISSPVSMAPLHDIGKIGIPDAILNKPGRLTPEEFEVMKGHVGIGVSVISRIYERTRYAPFAFAMDIIGTHHQKWDGGGYPGGLAGEEIPLCGRIVALADVFDAISSHRVYKPAYPRERCWDIINAGRGAHFDPRLVDVFNSMEMDMWEVVEEMRDASH